MYLTANIKKFPRGILDQVISCGTRRRPLTGRAPDPGQSIKPQKRQASSLSVKASSQASSQAERQAIFFGCGGPIVKRQAWRFAVVVYKT